MPTIDRNKLNEFKAYKPQGAGVKALDSAEKIKTVDNDVSKISFFVDGAGGARPMLSATPSPVTDPGRLPKVIDATPAQLAALKTDVGAFTTLLESTMTARKAYLNPTFGQLEGAPSRFKFNNIVGQRVKQFVDEGRALALELYGRDPAKLDKAYYAANTRAFDLLAREIQFDRFEVDGYASFGHDAAFIHAWEKRLDELSKVDTALLSPAQLTAHEAEKKQLQGELDSIFREKYVYNSSSMLETNAESSIGLCLIDKSSRNRVSEKASTLNTIVPAYETITLNGRGVFFDASSKKYYFDRTNQQVPEADVPNLQRRDVSARDCTFRRADTAGNEKLREGFRFDWDNDGYVSSQVISWVSWGGHCNDKANLEAKGLVLPNDTNGVHEYTSSSGSTAIYDRKLLNEKLMSFSEMTTLRNGESEFAAARDDDRPDRLSFGNITIPSYDRPNEFTITEIVKDGKTYEPEKAFGQHLLAADGRSAEKNPLYLDTVEGDRVRLNLGSATVKADAKVQVFDASSGYPTMSSQSIVIDFRNPSNQPQLIDSQMLNPATREMNEISLNVATKQLITQRVKWEPKTGGGFEKKNIGTPQTRTVDPAQMVGVHETSLDDPNMYFEFIKQALLKGEGFTAETADGQGVWNGVTHRLKEKVVFRDDETKWAKVELEVDARYGSGSGSFLIKLNDDGTPKYFVPESFAFDFLWRTNVHFDPQWEAQARGTPVERGVITAVGGRVQAEAVTNMLEILHCAFNKRPYVINHEGVRYFFDTKEQWEAEKAKLEQMRSAIYGAGPGPGPGPSTSGVLLEDTATLPKGEVKQYPVLTAEADGPMTIKLNTTRGDADLFVKVGGLATKTDFTKKAEAGGLKPDEVTLDVKKGDKIGIAVLGYAASDFSINATGPKAAAAEPTKIDFNLDATLARGEEKRFELRIKEDGKLNINMQGSGDADIYLKKGSAPTTDVADFKGEGNTAIESGTMDVKKGDVIHGLVYGYSATTFHLHINS